MRQTHGMNRKEPNRISHEAVASRLILTAVLLVALPGRAPASTNWTVLGWNNLGMHCMDSDFSVFSILPPYNTIHAQLIMGVDGTAHLITNDTFKVTYRAAKDPTGSINTTSIGKANFWDYVPPLYGVAVPPDVGLPVPGPDSWRMPGPNNVAQLMAYDPAAQWFAAYGIPITPYDDAGQTNTYPLLRLKAKQGAQLLAKMDIVAPVSDEMDCRVCHGSGTSAAAQPGDGWVNDPDPTRDYRLNILRLHDDFQLGGLVFEAALATNRYNSAGLYATVITDHTPITCAACHKSEALPGSGLPGIPPLTRAVHNLHAHVIDPTNGLQMDSSSNRSACYRCHPGSTTRCLRGAMGNAVADDGTMAMQCQSCHGSMSVVGAVSRTGWLDEPNCQACHTGDALNNNGQIRYSSVFTNGTIRTAVNQRFATNPNTPAAGLSLYRFSRGHGGLYCEACHGATHAEFPSSAANDNILSKKTQGHAGVLVECSACHAGQPNTVSGGPHGMHPVGQTWVSRHGDAVESGGSAQCQACHGKNDTGTGLSRAQADRMLVASFDQGQVTRPVWRGYRIGCYTCHDGPRNHDGPTANHPPVAKNVAATTNSGTPVALKLSASDTDANPLKFRIISQPGHGTVGLSGTTATYFPDPTYAGADTFTYSAWDGKLDSNLATGTVTIAASP